MDPQPRIKNLLHTLSVIILHVLGLMHQLRFILQSPDNCRGQEGLGAEVGFCSSTYWVMTLSLDILVCEMGPLMVLKCLAYE